MCAVLLMNLKLVFELNETLDPLVMASGVHW